MNYLQFNLCSCDLENNALRLMEFKKNFEDMLLSTFERRNKSVVFHSSKTGFSSVTLSVYNSSYNISNNRKLHKNTQELCLARV